MDDPIKRLPITAQRLVDVIGFRDALSVMEAFGGSRLDVPSKASHGLTRKLYSVLPSDAVIKLCHAWGGERVYIPKLDKAVRLVRDEEIRMQRPYKTICQLAKEYNLSERWVSEIVNYPVSDDGLMEELL